VTSFKVNNFLTLLFSSFDKENTGKISEKCFRKIMVGKDDISEKDIEEMLEEYYRYFLPQDLTIVF
jgi:Ca2+-binding EF-hand superfamily protein